MEEVNLNIVPNGLKPVCHASQYDKNRTIKLNLYEDYSRYSLTGSESLELDVKKPDGTIVTIEITNTSDNYLLFTTTEQMCAAYGQCECNIKITNGDIIIGTLNFLLDIEKSPKDGATESASSIYDLRQQVEDIISHMPIVGGGGLILTDVEINIYTYTTSDMEAS